MSYRAADYKDKKFVFVKAFGHLVLKGLWAALGTSLEVLSMGLGRYDNEQAKERPRNILKFIVQLAKIKQFGKQSLFQLYCDLVYIGQDDRLPVPDFYLECVGRLAEHTVEKVMEFAQDCEKKQGDGGAAKKNVMEVFKRLGEGVQGHGPDSDVGWWVNDAIKKYRALIPKLKEA